MVQRLSVHLVHRPLMLHRDSHFFVYSHLRSALPSLRNSQALYAAFMVSCFSCSLESLGVAAGAASGFDCATGGVAAGAALAAGGFPLG